MGLQALSIGDRGFLLSHKAGVGELLAIQKNKEIKKRGDELGCFRVNVPK
jgi:hypothetical protein